MSNDDDLVSITDVTTTDGGGVILNVSRTFYRDPKAPRWQISIIAEDVDDPENPPAVAGHMCHCGDGPHEKGEEPCREIITLGSDAAIRLAHEIPRFAGSLSDGAQHR